MKALKWLTLCTFLFTVTFVVYAGDLTHEKIQLESAINSQLTGELSAFLPEGAFAVFTSVVLKETSVRQLVQGEKYTPPTGVPLANENPVPVMPGFQPGMTQPVTKPTAGRREIYTVKERQEIQKVAVRVLLDKTLPKELVNVAKSTVTQRLRSSYGKRARASFQRADLSMSKAARNANTGDWFSFLKEYWWLILALMFGAALLVGMINRMLRRRADSFIPPSSPEKETIDVPSTPYNGGVGALMNDPVGSIPHLSAASGAPPQSPHLLPPPSVVQFEVLLEGFLEEISAEPLIARSFLSRLDEPNKELLHACFETSSLKEALSRLLSFQTAEGAGPNWNGLTGEEVQEKKREGLKKISGELLQYRKLLKIQMRERFGYLSLLNPGELRQVMDGETEEAVYSMLKHLPRSVSQNLVRQLSPELKRRLVAMLSQSPDLTELQIEEIEKRIRAKVDGVSQSILTPQASNDTLVDLIIEGTDDRKEILGDLIQSNQELYQRYKYHFADFNDFLRQAPSAIALVLSDLSNEAIALAICHLPEDQRNRTLGGLPEMRRKIVGSLILGLSGREIDESVTQARNAILGSFRRVLKDQENRGSSEGARP